MPLKSIYIFLICKCNDTESESSSQSIGFDSGFESKTKFLLNSKVGLIYVLFETKNFR